VQRTFELEGNIKVYLRLAGPTRSPWWAGNDIRVSIKPSNCQVSKKRLRLLRC